MLNLKRSILFAVPAIAVVLLSGCGSKYYSDRNYEYYNAKMVKPLQLPASRNQSEFIDAMPVPNAANKFVAPKGHFHAPLPPGINDTNAQPTVQVREANSQRWLVVASSPSDVWPQLTYFAEQQGNGVKATLPQQGTIETNDFTIAVRQGTQANTTEVYCLTNNTTNQSCISALQSQLSQGSSDSND